MSRISCHLKQQFFKLNGSSGKNSINYRVEICVKFKIISKIVYTAPLKEIAKLVKINITLLLIMSQQEC